MVFSVLRNPVIKDAHRKQVYVEDSVIAIRRTSAERRRPVARATITWILLGVTLAVRNVQLGPSVEWIGANFTVLAAAVEAVI